MIRRRDLLIGCVAAVTKSPNISVAATVPPNLRFEVLRNGSNIGYHEIKFRQNGMVLEAEITVDIAVRLGPITLFRYGLKAREVWQEGQFLSLESETNDDGTRYRVRAIRTPEHVAVEVSGAPSQMFAPTTLPLTHWSDQCMERPLFNPQDGQAIASTVVPRGEEPVQLADRRVIPASRYSLVGETNLDDFYDHSRNWAALIAPATDGSRIEYRRAI